jgi:hypothetical protein
MRNIKNISDDLTSTRAAVASTALTVLRIEELMRKQISLLEQILIGDSIPVPTVDIYSSIADQHD